MTEVTATTNVGAPTTTVDTSTAAAPVATATETSVAPTASVASTSPEANASPSIETPIIETVAPAEVVAPVVESTKEPTLLGGEEPVKTDPTTAEEKPTADAEVKEVSQSEEPAPLPTYEPFVLPDDVKVDNERLTDFTKTLAQFESTTKASHEEVQKLGQSLVDRHIAEVRLAQAQQMDAIVQQWTDKKTSWVNEFKNDPELGGKRYETSISEAKEFVRTHGGTPEQISAFYDALKETGMEAHPAMVRFLINVKNSSNFRTPQPILATKPVEQNKSKVAKRYGNNS